MELNKRQKDNGESSYNVNTGEEEDSRTNGATHG
jgi:hypothetical protein